MFDRPPQPEARFVGGRTDARALWRVEHPVRAIPAGTTLRIEATEWVEVRWRVGCGPEQALPDEPTFLGVRVADLPADALADGAEVRLTVTRPGDDGTPLREDYVVRVR